MRKPNIRRIAKLASRMESLSWWCGQLRSPNARLKLRRAQCLRRARKWHTAGHKSYKMAAKLSFRNDSRYWCKIDYADAAKRYWLGVV